MTHCFDARERMLEAAPDELAGLVPSDLAGHLGICSRCGRLARLLLDEHARLGTALASVRPTLSADASVDVILGLSDIGVLPAPPRRAERVRRFLVAALPMAAAAALAAYFVYGNESLVPVPVAPSMPIASGVRVTAGPGTATAALATNNPNFTLVWIGQEIIP